MSTIIFEINIAIQYLKGKNTNFFSIMTIFSIVGITLGVATLIVVMSVMNGFREKLIESIFGINGHINVYFNKSLNSDYNTILKSIEKIPGILSIKPVTSDQAIIASNDKIINVIVRGILTKDLFNNSIIKNNIIAGNIKNFDNGIIIGSKLAESLNVNCGNKVTFILYEGFNSFFNDSSIKMKEYEIIAIFDIGVFEYDNALVYIPIKLAQSFFNYNDNIRNIEVFINDINKAKEIANTIEIETGMEAESWQLQQNNYFKALKTERNVMFLILTLIIIVASFNITSNLVMIVEEKKSAIAIMRTFGATSKTIIRIFCICGLLIGFIGTCFGCVIGITFSLNIENIRIFLEKVTNVKLFDPMIYFFSNLPVILVPRDVITISIFSLTLSFLATIGPALKATLQDPAKILRYE